MAQVAVRLQRPEKAASLITAGARQLKVVIAFAGLMLTAATCRHVVEDPSSFALANGDATMALGSSCTRGLELGYGACQLKKNQPMPELRLYFPNPAEYAVSDCELGIYATGSADVGETVVDLKGLTAQVQKYGFCLLRIEAKERYPDPRADSQKREIPFAGGWFLEVLPDGYFPEPAEEVVSWCVKIKATNKGRRKFEKC